MDNPTVPHSIKERRIAIYARLMTAEHALDQALRAASSETMIQHDLVSALEIVRAVMANLKRLEKIPE